MTDKLVGSGAVARGARASDRRSREKRERIVTAVLRVLAEVGISGLTHRRVAKAGNLPIAATTYHFATKAEMLAQASDSLLTNYLRSFRRIAENVKHSPSAPHSLWDLTVRLIVNCVDRNRNDSLAWCEIMLDAARTDRGHEMARRWFEGLELAWIDLAAALGADPSRPHVNSAIDTVIGLMFIALATGLNEEGVRRLLAGELSDFAEVSVDEGTRPSGGEEPREKATRTREAILAATMRVILDGGAGAVTYRAVSDASGVSLSVVAYHFGSIDRLIRHAEARLFEAAKDRYRQSFTVADPDRMAVADLADVTAAILVRETTAFGGESLAHYSVWLEAARFESLRPDVVRAVRDQAIAWSRRTRCFGDSSFKDGILFQALFIGRLIRELACGAPVAQLAGFRAEIDGALNRRFPAPKSGT